MKLADEAALRRRLHEEIDLAEVGPAPADAVFRQSRRVRARRLAVIATGVAIAALGGILVTRTLGSPAGPPGPAGEHSPKPGVTAPAHGVVFASGIAHGHMWRLAAVNLADPSSGCLPGVVLDGRNGDVLRSRFLPGYELGNLGFLAAQSGRPGIGYAFVLLKPGVTGVAADLGDGTRLGLRPVAVGLCGQRFRLAGFAYPRQGVTRLTARSAQGHRIEYTPLADFFNPASNWQTGTWINVGPLGDVAAGVIGSGRASGIGSWRMRVTLGQQGECFTVVPPPPGRGFFAQICGNVAPAPHGAVLMPLPYGGSAVWYPGAVNPRTAYLLAHLSDGTTRRLVPALVGGRKYVAFGVNGKVRLVRLTLYDARGHVLAQVRAQVPR